MRAQRLPDVPYEFKAYTGPRVEKYGAIAIIPIDGVLFQHVGWLEAFFGGISTEAIGAAIGEAVADKSVRKIILAINSPGGSVVGVTELASKVRAARDVKPVIAVANSHAYSAAYHVASQASEIWVPPSGGVGSIGCICEYVDDSQLLEKAGLRVTRIVSGKYKGENRGEPITDEGLAKLQTDADYYYGLMVRDIARGRGVSEAVVSGPSFGQGRTVLPTDAKANGLVDRIGTLGDAILKHSGPNADRVRAVVRVADLEA
jgi:signal peptide peptidase SppA